MDIFGLNKDSIDVLAIGDHKVKDGDLATSDTNIQCSMQLQFSTLPTGKLNSSSLSPVGIESPVVIGSIQMDRNPFNTMNIGIIPGPMSLRCDNKQFIQEWVKYILQSAISVICHTLTFFIVVLWIRFIFSSYYNYQLIHDEDNEISKNTASILSHLPCSSWIWISIALTNTALFVGFMIQSWIIPIQWNFEDNSNTKLFRYFGIIFLLSIILCHVIFDVLQIFSYSIFYSISVISQLIIVMIFSFVLLFVIIKNGRNADQLRNENGMENDIDLSSSSPSELSPSSIPKVMNNQNKYNKIFQEIRQKSKRRIIMALSNDHSCFKLFMISALFSFIITCSVASLYINFNFALKFVISNSSEQNHMLFDEKFIIHLVTILFGTLFVGDLFMLFMKILMRWLTILLSDSSYDHDSSLRSLSFNAHYASMQSFNRMILFVIPLMFMVKLSVFIMLYTFTDLIQFTIAVIVFCIFSRCFNIIFSKIENKMLQNLLNNNDSDEYYYYDAVSDHHLLAQYNYIHDMIHYINILFAPLIFVMFRINLKTDQDNKSILSQSHYLNTTLIQFIIESLFDLFPLFIILIGKQQERAYGSFYHLSRNSPIMIRNKENDKKSENKCFDISNLAINLKIEYINMMNGWTATDKCVRYYMWWSTIFIAGYFAFYLLYPQQFLCAKSANIDSFIFDDLIYIQCQ